MNEDLSSIDGIGAGLENRYEYAAAEAPFAPVGSIYEFFGGGGRAAVLDAVSMGLGNGESLIQVHGEPGSGKTMLAGVLADRFAASHNIIRVDGDTLSVNELLQQLLIDLCPAQMSRPKQAHRHETEQVSSDLQHDREMDRVRGAVVERLVTGTPGDKPILILLDSAAPMTPALQRLVEELSEVRRRGQRMLQAVVFESASADDARMARTNTTPHNKYYLRRLSLAEIGQYLQHHMVLFDFNRRDTFSREMVYFIAERSEGLFRSINQIARSSFTLARLEGRNRPSMSHLLLAGLPRVEEPEPRRGFMLRHRKAVFALLGSTVVASAATLVMLSSR